MIYDIHMSRVTGREWHVKSDRLRVTCRELNVESEES